jgi:UDP-N-acetylmuramyl tripeptide synthase
MTIVEASAAVAALDRLGVARQRMTLIRAASSPATCLLRSLGPELTVVNSFGRHWTQGRRLCCKRLPVPTPPSATRECWASAISPHSGHIAGEFYAHPAAAMRVFGVTGTNGKTSITNWLMQAYGALGMRCAAIGTLGVTLGEREWPTSNTTPDAVHLQTILRDLREAGAEAVAMDKTPTPWSLGGSGMRFDAAIFTNLTRIIWTSTAVWSPMARTKAKLFSDYPARHRIINADDAFGRELIRRQLLARSLTVCTKVPCVAPLRQMRPDGMQPEHRLRRTESRSQHAADGRFNASNLLAVAAALGGGWRRSSRAGAVLVNAGGGARTHAKRGC